MSRGVAVPKPTGGGRPICISSLFVKLMGLICMERDATGVSHHQYAVGTKDGHTRIVHKVLDFVEHSRDAAVVRFDVSNAFGTMPRHIIKRALQDTGESLKQYFRLVYGSPSDIAIYGQHSKFSFVKIADGVKQGDACSSYLFCVALDRALGIAQAAMNEMGIAGALYAYMDDITICVSSTNASKAADIMISALERIGLKVNADKSKILTQTQGVYSLPSVSHHEPFIVLGANVAMSENACRVYEEQLIVRSGKYFDILSNVALHPLLEFNLLKTCGAPRIRYHCGVTKHIHGLASFFDAQVRKRVSWILDPSGELSIPHDKLFSKFGIGMPCYSAHHAALFSNCKRMALSDDPDPVRMSLHIDSDPDDYALSQVDAQYLFFDKADTISPADFSTSLAMRLNILPQHLKLAGNKCNCGFIYNGDDSSTVEHILKCDMSTPITHTTRHNMVRDAIVRHARTYGITTTKEPTIFTYKDGHKRRPDILFHTSPFSIAVDVTMIATDRVLADAEKEKRNMHNEACAKQQCVFYPFAMNSRGTLGKAAEELIKSLTKAIQPALHQIFAMELHHCVSVAAAKGRAHALLAAVDRHAYW